MSFRRHPSRRRRRSRNKNSNDNSRETVKTQSGFARLAQVGLVVCAASAVLSGQSLSYSRGQNVSPAFEGWEQNADGSFNMMFGYMNRNWEEELDVPVGPENNISPGP